MFSASVSFLASASPSFNSAALLCSSHKPLLPYANHATPCNAKKTPLVDEPNLGASRLNIPVFDRMELIATNLLRDQLHWGHFDRSDSLDHPHLLSFAPCHAILSWGLIAAAQPIVDLSTTQLTTKAKRNQSAAQSRTRAFSSSCSSNRYFFKSSPATSHPRPLRKRHPQVFLPNPPRHRALALGVV